MEYVYAAMLLHQAGKKVDEESLRKVIEAAGVTPDEAKIKSLLACLDGVDIGKVLEEAKSRPVAAAAAPVAAGAPAEGGGEKEAAKEKKKEEKKEEAAEGLASLFG